MLVRSLFGFISKRVALRLLIGCVLVSSVGYVEMAQAVRASNALLALYEFTETSGATIVDTSGVGAPLNLTISSTNDVNMDGQRLDINNPIILESALTNDKIYQACKASNELTVEAWLMAESTNLYGPARIVTHSIDGGARNFSLAQHGGAFKARLGTSTSGNYFDRTIQNAAVSLSNLQHIVFTRSADGTAKFYLNGSVVDTWSWSGDFSSWQSNRKLAMANEYAASNIQDRDWQGELHLVAIYSRSLSNAEVSANYAVGANPSGASISFSGATPVDFGTTSVGSTVQKNLTIDNTGTEPLNINSLNISGLSLNQYSVVSDNCVSGLVQPGASCTVTIEFSP